VFPGKKGKKLTDVKKSFRTAMREAGIEDFCFHDLRHTFASHLVMAGVPLLTVAELLGHKSIEMTKRYSHLSPNHKATAVRMLDALCDEKQEIKSTSEGSS
jgi:integrase